MSKLSAVIMAAGLSSRMGDFKPLLQIGDDIMIGHVIRMMQLLEADPIIVVTGHRHEELEAAIQDRGVEIVFNPDYATTQQMESLQLALRKLEGRTDRIAVTPADIPSVDLCTAQRLLETPGDFVRPLWHGKGGHPVLLTASLIPWLMTYEGPGGLRGAIGSHPSCRITEIPVEDRGTILDNDTPSDLIRLKEWLAEKDVRQKQRRSLAAALASTPSACVPVEEITAVGLTPELIERDTVILRLCAAIAPAGNIRHALEAMGFPPLSPVLYRNSADSAPEEASELLLYARCFPDTVQTRQIEQIEAELDETSLRQALRKAEANRHS